MGHVACMNLSDGTPKLNSSGDQQPRCAVTLVHVTTVPETLKSFFRGQVTHLKERGFQFIGVSSPGPDLDDFARREAVRTYGVPMIRGISLLHDLKSLLALWRLFRQIKPDIVHGSTPKAALLTMLAAVPARVPIRVYTLRGLMIEMPSGLTRGLFYGLEWITCRLADLVIAVSRSVADTMVARKLCTPGKLRVLAHGSSNGVDAEIRFNPLTMDPSAAACKREDMGIPGDATVIGFIGRLVKDKGITELTGAWKRIRDNHEDAWLLLIGPEEPHNPVPSSILEHLRNDTRVRMIDHVPNREMPTYYGMMDLVVLPTYREGFPNVVLEASAMELPVVATRVTGCVDAVVDHVTGILCAPHDATSLAQAIETYLDNAELRARHGQAGRLRVLRDFRSEPIWESLTDEYEQMLRTKGISLSSRAAQDTCNLSKV
jgi:glycosyltransferase involved in cell wall biosynthesis